MKFVHIDDMHLEFSDFHLPGDSEAILLLAGDIMTKNEPTRFFREECAKYKKAYWIAGNHEFYGSSWEGTRDYMRKKTEGTNVTVLEKEWVDLGEDIHMYAATFWTDFRNADPVVMALACQYMNDYRLISCNNHYTDGMYTNNRVGTLRPQVVLDDHQIAFQALKDGLEERKGKKIVVMTHHAPSLRSSHPRYGGTSDPINWAYCSELDYFIEQHPQIKYFVHGHTHESHDYMLGTTNVRCNPRGYDYKVNGHGENPNFDPSSSFEV